MMEPYPFVPQRAFRLLAASAVALSHTGDTAETDLAAITIPGGSMGANGLIRINSLWTFTNSVNNKILRARFDGTAIFQVTMTTSAVYADLDRIIANRNAANSQIGRNVGAQGAQSTSAALTMAANTLTDRVLRLTAALADAGETITLESYQVEICHQP